MSRTTYVEHGIRGEDLAYFINDTLDQNDRMKVEGISETTKLLATNPKVDSVVATDNGFTVVWSKDSPEDVLRRVFDFYRYRGPRPYRSY